MNKFICQPRETETSEERYLYNDHNDVTYAKFTACPMKNGNRSMAEKVARRCVAPIKVKEGKESLTFFARSIRRVKPLIYGSSSTRGRKTKIAPMPSERGRRLAMQWIIQGAKKRLERGMASCIYLELLGARAKQGYAIKKNEGPSNEVLGGGVKNS